MGLFTFSRRSAVSGKFYPANAGELRAQVATYLTLPPQSGVSFTPADVLAVMVPHAGYVFSGAIAGVTLGQVGLPERLVVLGPNHTGQGVPISVWDGGPWSTPLGSMAIDEPMRDALISSNKGANAGFMGDKAAHTREHSLEVLVPFFQVKNPDAVMTPITVAGAPLPVLKRAGETLAAQIREAAGTGPQPLLVISSDMSHYLPHEEAVKMDSLALRAIESLDAEYYYNAIRKFNISMCGLFPMTLALYALAELGAKNVHRIAYATSGQTGRAYGADMQRVVGYAGVVITR
ncbi:MAG: hypothetical protein DELT_00615 [Desulfovibrio sp.]